MTGRLLDLLLIVDSSGSISEGDFNTKKEQLSRLMGSLCPQPDPFNGSHRAALLRYSTDAQEIFDFDDNLDTSGVQSSIDSMTYSRGSTCTGKAFDYARTNMFTAAKGMFLF